MMNIILLIAGFYLIFIGGEGMPKGHLTRKQVYDLAKATVNKYGFNVDVTMLSAIAMIESSGDARARRYEPHLKDSSYGLTQTLYQTAKWLNKDMGYRQWALNEPNDLYDAERSMYFGAAYLDWIKKVRPSWREEYIVRSYNGGLGGFNKDITKPYWTKYKKEKAVISKTIIEA